DLQQGGAQASIGAATQGAIGVIDPIALVAGWDEAGASGDVVGMGIESDRSQLAGDVGGADHVDAGNDQQQHVRSADQVVSALPFQPGNLLDFAEAIVVEAAQDLPEQFVLRMASGSLFGPA